MDRLVRLVRPESGGAIIFNIDLAFLKGVQRSKSFLKMLIYDQTQ